MARWTPADMEHKCGVSVKSKPVSINSEKRKPLCTFQFARLLTPLRTPSFSGKDWCTWYISCLMQLGRGSP